MNGMKLSPDAVMQLVSKLTADAHDEQMIEGIVVTKRPELLGETAVITGIKPNDAGLHVRTSQVNQQFADIQGSGEYFTVEISRATGKTLRPFSKNIFQTKYPDLFAELKLQVADLEKGEAFKPIVLEGVPITVYNEHFENGHYIKRGNDWSKDSHGQLVKNYDRKIVIFEESENIGTEVRRDRRTLEYQGAFPNQVANVDTAEKTVNNTASLPNTQTPPAQAPTGTEGAK